MLNCDESSEHLAFWKNNVASTGKTRRGAIATLPMVELKILRGQARQKVRRVQGPVFLIGAAMDCDLVLREQFLPEVHTYLYVTREAITVRHLGAAPGLFIGNRRVEAAQVYDGDCLRIGESFEFQVSIQYQSSSKPSKSPQILRLDSAQRHLGHFGVSNRQVLLSPN